MKRVLVLTLAASLLALAPAVVQARGVTIQKVRGDLAATAEDSDAIGRFCLAAVSSGERGAERLDVSARGLDAEEEYEVLLGGSTGDPVSFGEMRVGGRKGHGRFSFSSRRDDYPEGVESLTEFSGGTILVVSGDETVLEGEIPEFVDPGTDDEAGEGSFAAGIGTAKLSPPEGDDSRAGAILGAVALSTPKGAREQLSLLALGLDEEQEYGVFLVGEEGADDDELGTLRPRGRLGVAVLVLDTRRGDELPDHLAALADRTVEVRDEAGDVALTGTFPSLR